jgi:hypothetical protein
VALSVIVAACWGIYALSTATDLSISGSAIAPLVRLGTRLWSGALASALALGALGALFVAAAWALRARVAAVTRRAARAEGEGDSLPPVLWAGLLAASAVLSLWPVDAWRVFLLGLGVAGAVAVAPGLAARDAVGRSVGAAVGALVFVTLAVATAPLPGWSLSVSAYPAVVAAPAAWIVARLVHGGRRRVQ